jgi:hypothetical protein
LPPRWSDKRVDEATGERKRFSSAILPLVPQVPEDQRGAAPALPDGLSSGDFVPALEQFLGSSAGLSPATITRLTQQWQADHAAFMDRDLADVDYVWAVGIHLNVRLEEAKACVLVLIGVRVDVSKEPVAPASSGAGSIKPRTWLRTFRNRPRVHRCCRRVPAG